MNPNQGFINAGALKIDFFLKSEPDSGSLSLLA